MSDRPATEPPPFPEPRYSLDGHFYWNGQQWVPVPAPPPRSHAGRWILGIAIAGVLLCSGLCTAAAVAGSNPSTRPSSAPAGQALSSPPGNPKAQTCKAPCQDDEYGWLLEVSRVRYDAQSGTVFAQPESGNVFVTLDVTFTNRKTVEKNASPLDLKLKDGSGTIHDVSWKGFPGCEIWSSVTVAPSGTYGPKCTTFEATAGKPSGLVLIWRPGGPLGGDYTIPLN